MEVASPQQSKQSSLPPQQQQQHALNGVSVRRHNSLPSRNHHLFLRRDKTLERMTGSSSSSSSKSYKPETTAQRPHYTAKFNPYVGWFRHSPDTSRRSTTCWNNSGCNCNSTKTNKLCFSPLSSSLGWFHKTSTVKSVLFSSSSSPCKKQRLESSSEKDGSSKKDATMQLLALVEATLPTSVTTTTKTTLFACYQMHELADFLAGRLRGGSPSSSLALYSNQDHLLNNRRRDNIRPLNLYSSTKLLLNVAHWVLKPFFEDFLEDDSQDDERDEYASSSLKSLDNDSLTTFLDDDEHDIGDDDEEDSDKPEGTSTKGLTTTSSSERQNAYQRQRSSSFLLNESSSQEAEAYYAHQAAKELNPDEVSPSRLNHVITQMDIIRMQRNASRHLDVESIYQLPTFTYRKNRQHNQDPTGSTDNSKSEAWSWMLIGDGTASSQALGSSVAPKQRESQGETIVQAEEEHDVCVICLEAFVYGDRLRVLPCNHSFHMGCVDRWLSGSASFEDCHTNGCPTCKKRPVVGPPAAPEFCVPTDESLVKEEAYPKRQQDEEDDDTLILAGETSDGNVPSWAFCELGSALLARDSQML